MTDTEHREQHNHGSGTFVGGDVNGGIWHVFFPPYGKKHTSDQPPRRRGPDQDDDETDDYEDVATPLVGSAVAAFASGLPPVYAVMGWSLSAGAAPPGIAERAVAGIFFSYVCVACVAAFFARLAQVFELWSEQCAITATQNRGRWVARPPALIARAMAALCAAAAAIAEILASLYGWQSFGGKVSRRAHIARLNAASNGRTAHRASRDPENR